MSAICFVDRIQGDLRPTVGDRQVMFDRVNGGVSMGGNWVAAMEYALEIRIQ